MSQLTVTGLVFREIRFRKWSFLLATSAVAAAAAMIFGAEAMLRVDRCVTERFLQQRQSETEISIQAHEEKVNSAGAQLQDAVPMTLGHDFGGLAQLVGRLAQDPHALPEVWFVVHRWCVLAGKFDRPQPSRRDIRVAAQGASAGVRGGGPNEDGPRSKKLGTKRGKSDTVGALTPLRCALRY